MNFKVYLFWDENDELYPILINELKLAYSNGYSIIELARRLNHRTAIKLYEILRKEEIISKIGRKRQPRYQIPVALKTALSKCKLSYLQWCASHGIDPEITANALAIYVDESNSHSLAAHRSFRIDFPALYSKLFHLHNQFDAPSAQTIALSELPTKYTVVIKYNHTKLLYEAEIPEIPECRAAGFTRDNAYFSLKKKNALLMSIEKLRVLNQLIYQSQ